MVKKYLLLLLCASACAQATEQEQKARASLTQEEIDGVYCIGAYRDPQMPVIPKILIDNAADSRYNHLLRQYIESSSKRYVVATSADLRYSLIAIYVAAENEAAVRLLARKHKERLQSFKRFFDGCIYADFIFCSNQRLGLEGFIKLLPLYEDASKGNGPDATAKKIAPLQKMVEILTPTADLESEMWKESDDCCFIQKRVCQQLCSPCAQLYTYCKQSRLVDWWEGWNG